LHIIWNKLVKEAKPIRFEWIVVRRLKVEIHFQSINNALISFPLLQVCGETTHVHKEIID
jgi:hypothetical protein